MRLLQNGGSGNGDSRIVQRLVNVYVSCIFASLHSDKRTSREELGRSLNAVQCNPTRVCSTLLAVPLLPAFVSLIIISNSSMPLAFVVYFHSVHSLLSESCELVLPSILTWKTMWRTINMRWEKLYWRRKIKQFWFS